VDIRLFFAYHAAGCIHDAEARPACLADDEAVAFAELDAALAHPPNLLCRIADVEGEVGDIFGHNGTGTNHGKGTDGVATNDDSISADCGAALDERALVLGFAHDVTARIDYICEDHAGPAEDIIFELDGVVDGDVVLDFDIVADAGVAHIDVLTEGAVAADSCPASYMCPVPYARALSDDCAVVDDGGFMSGVGHFDCGVVRHRELKIAFERGITGVCRAFFAGLASMLQWERDAAAVAG